MTMLFAAAVFACVACGLYLALSRDLLRIVLGLAVLGNGINLALLAAGRVGATAPAVLPAGTSVLEAAAANPLPQALVLTAIVIGFALLCYSLVLALRLIVATSTTDIDRLHHAEPKPADPVKPPVAEPADEPVWPEGPAR